MQTPSCQSCHQRHWRENVLDGKKSKDLAESVYATAEIPALLHCHKDRTDRIRLLDVANEFVKRNDNRKRNFGIFTKDDIS